VVSSVVAEVNARDQLVFAELDAQLSALAAAEPPTPTVWCLGDRVKVVAGRYRTRLGTVLRTTGDYVEVALDSMVDAGTGIVAFEPENLQLTIKKARK
jgi:hypothetical protein